MNPIRTLAASLAIILITATAPAIAHPHLLRATPAPSASVSNVRSISLTFSEPLIAPLSGFDVTMTGMPGAPNPAKHHAMKMSGIRTSLASDGKTLSAALARPLPIGTYDVTWHAVSTDTHRVAGKLSFTVH